MSNERRRQGPRGPMGRGMRGNGEKAKNFKGTLKKLFVYLKPYYFKLTVVIIFAAGSTVFTIIGPKILAKATDKLSEGIMAKVSNTGGIDFDYIGMICLILVGFYLVSALFSFIQGFITSSISQKVAYDLRSSLSKKMSKMPLSYFDRHSSGDTLSKFITSDYIFCYSCWNLYYDAYHLCKDDIDCCTCFTTFHVTYYVCYETFPKVF